ncbi:heterokaryon incompatibility protein-domain-containing protein [Lasiosphaeria ovina]|uniref:Heterokaryon incompatibility protein-domain-containing protein n=1 Tax=Lasiosphaeria ovina TaxID=92902 RepID=A0AAE0NID4_9PEZI|nr:heterokaryon incompatibility protein-domain-containing protein [Lasiosphaeria ovina]
MHPLPGPRCIRLVDVELGPEDEAVSISIQAHQLETAPPYDALSYTWGDPSSPLVFPPEMSMEDAYILCDGKPLAVRPNLASALRALRAPASTPGRLGIPRQALIWIDAICINQDDLAERAAQVAMMGDVYGRAETVIVWLGPEDASTDDAMRVLNRLSAVPESALAAARDSSLPLDIRNPGVYSRQLAMDPVPMHEWLGWIAFVERNYFRRAWIIQEVVKARQLVFLCGAHVFSWHVFSAAYSFLHDTRWLEILTPSYLLTYLAPSEIPERYRRFLDPDRHTVEDSAMVVRYARQYLAEAGRSIALIECLRLFRSSLCSDPRDKVFSILSIIDENSPELEACPDIRRVDYAVPVPELYLLVAWSSIQSSLDLAILKHKEQEDETRVKGLPSWVPDWSAPHTHTPLDSDDTVAAWDASAGLHFLLPPVQRNRHLPVQGVRIGSVAALSADSSFAIEFWASLAPLAAGMAPSYSSRFEDKDAPHNACSRLELLSRTLWRDQINSLNLSPTQAHSLTLGYILWQLHLGYVEATLVDDQILLEPRPRDEWDWQRRIRENSDDWQPMPLFRPLIALLSTESFLSPVKLDLALAFAEELAETNQAEVVIDSSRTEKTSDDGGEHHAMAVVSGEELARYINVGLADRRVARNADLGMSLVPECARPGDEIWVLAGAKTPYILRSSEVSDRYSVVGEAFVHHIMAGQAAASGEAVRDLVLQ